MIHANKSGPMLSLKCFFLLSFACLLRQTAVLGQTGVSSSSPALIVTGWMESMLFLVGTPRKLTIYVVLYCVTHFFSFSGKVIDGLLIMRKIEVKASITISCTS